MQTFPLEEYRAIRERAALLDRPPRGRIAVTGRDRLPYLHALLTNDIASLRPGTGRYAAYLTPQGRMIADMRVLELGDLTLVDVEERCTADVAARLDQFVFSEDVQVADLTASLAETAIAGPDSAVVLENVIALERGPGGAALAALNDHDSIGVRFNGATLVIAASRELGVPGFDLYVDRERAEGLVAAISAAGVARAGSNAVDAVRIEAGTPRFGVDMDNDTIPLEAGIEQRAISFSKGCYPGQEVITRVVQRGHGRVVRKLCGVRLDERVTPAAGAPFVVDGKETGRVTSATYSPSLDAAIGLGYLHRDYATPGTIVSVVHADRHLAATVVPLPFVG